MTTNNEAINHLMALAAQLPADLRSDWKGTNHFELTSSEKDNYWWLDFPDINEELQDNNIIGQRVGLLMDLAVAAQQALPALKEITCT